jgi:hypothetical protein
MYVKLSWRPEVDENWVIMVVQLNAKNQYALLPGISVTVLASLFSSVRDNFRSPGSLDLHVWYLKTFVNASALYVKLSWRPEVDENWVIMVVQPTILTYPTMVFYFWLAPQVLWNDLRGNKKYYLPVPMSARITKYLNKYVRRGLCLIYMSSFYFWSSPLGRKIRKKCTNIFRYNTCMSSYPGDRKWTKIES